jgi:E3 ubiquitin-protein ligase DOA10
MDHSGGADQLSDRMAFYLSDDLETRKETRKEIIKNFKRVYKMRSDYVHHRRSTTDQMEVNFFGNLSWRLIRKMISQVDDFENKEEFIEYIDDRKYGKPPN